MHTVSFFPVQQGEVRLRRIDAVPVGVETKAVKRGPQGYVISHSENGNHHLLTGGDVIERVQVPAGMQFFYAILDAPQQLIQDAQNPHEGYDLPAGIYEFRISRAFDSFSEQARRVVD